MSIPTACNKAHLESANDPGMLAAIGNEIPPNDSTTDESSAESNRSESNRKDQPSVLNEEKPFIDTLARYDVTEARLINQILSHNCGFEIQLQNGGFEFEIIFEQHACRANIQISLCVGDTDFVIGLERCLFTNIEAVDQLDDLPEQVRNLYFEVLLENICEHIESWSGLPVQIKSFGPAKGIKSPDLRLRLDFRMMRQADGQLSKGFVITSGRGLRMINKLMAALPMIPAHEHNHLILLTRVEIGKARLKIKNFKQIEPQDIILIATDDSGSSKSSCRFYPAPRFYYAAVWNQDENHITIMSTLQEDLMSNIDENEEGFDEQEEEFNEGEEEFDEDEEDFDDDEEDFDEDEEEEYSNNDAESQDSAATIDNLPIELTFDVGSIPLTLGELKCLREGCIIETRQTGHAPVRIRVNGKIIGTGELVRLSGHMGVRVLKMEVCKNL